VTESNWASATRDVLICPRCGGMNLAIGAKPTIVQEQDGSYSCAQCGYGWREPPPPKDDAA